MDLAEASRLYQIALEYTRTTIHHGTDEDDDAIEFLNASRAVEVAWLQATNTKD